MKRTLLLLFFALSQVYLGWGQIVAWESNGLTGGGTAPWSATTIASNIQGTPQITVGSGCNVAGGTPPANAFVRTAMIATNQAGAITGNDYFEFSIGPSSGYKVSYTTIDANFRRTTTGASNFIFQYSLDGFATAGNDIGSSATYLNNSNGVAITQITLSGITALQNVTGTVAFRLYWWGETGSTQSAGIGRLSGNDLAIGGTVALASDVTAPNWTVNYPKAENATPSGFTSKVNIDEPGTAYFVVLTNGATAPSSAQVKAGQDASSTPLAENLKGTIACIAGSTEYTAAVNGLTSSTDYDVYFVAEDDETTPNLQASPTKVDVATTADASSNSIVVTNNGEQATISSLENDATISTALDGVNVWNIYVQDGGGATDADIKPTIYTGFVFYAGELNTVTDWTNSIQAAALFDNTTLTKVADAVINSNNLTFSGFTYSVADDDIEELTLLISLKTTVTDQQKFQFSLTGSGVTTQSSNTSSQIDPGMTPIVSDGTKNVIAVVATKLAFLQQPTNTLVNVDMSPAVTVQALDANNNLDLDASAQVTITSTGTLADAQSNALSSGLATFGNIMHSATGTGLALTATADGLTNAVSSFFDIFMEVSVGGIGFVAYATDGTDDFAFVALANIEANLQIKFTDNAWTGSALATNEGTLTWTSPAGGVAKGTVVTITPPSTASSGTVSGANFAMATSGDQILAYQGSSSSPNFIAGVSSTNWITSGSTTSNSSYLPSELTLNLTAVTFSTEMDNGYYNGPQTLANGAALSFIFNSDSWLRNDASQTLPTWTFNLGSQTTIDVNTTIQDITIEVGEVLQINKTNTLTVSGTLTNNATASGLVIKSDATGTGSLIHQNTGVTGTVERYVAAANWASATNGWHLLSSPVASQAISGDWTPSGTNNDYDIYIFDESKTTEYWLNQKVGANNITTFEVGKGYLSAYEQTGTKTFTGELNVSNVTFSSLANTSGSAYPGYHLVANPFSSAITWTTGTWTKTNIDAEAQVWDAATSSYKTTTEKGNIIPSMNGFMVHTSGNGTLTIPANARAHNAANWYKSDEEFIILNANDPEGQTSQSSLIRFNPLATGQFDSEYDCYFLEGFAPAFYSKSGNDLFALNTLQEMSEGLMIPFDFIKNNSTLFNIELTKNITGTVVYLTDKKTNITHNLTQNPVYAFTSSSGDDPNRFELKFGMVGIEDPANISSVNAYFFDGKLFVNTMEKNCRVNIFNANGQQLDGFKLAGEGLQSVALRLPVGIYMAQIMAGNTMQTVKFVVQ